MGAITPWTPAELAVLAMDLPAASMVKLLPGRSRDGVLQKRRSIHGRKSTSPWSAEEEAVLRLNLPSKAILDRLPGRTLEAVKSARTNRGIVSPRFAPETVPGRSLKDRLREVTQAVAAGATKSSLDRAGVIKFEVLQRWFERIPTLRRTLEPILVKNAVEARRLNGEREREAAIARRRPSGELVMRACSSAVSRTLPPDVRQDVIGALALAVMEGRVPFDGIGAAAREYVARHYRAFTKFGFVSLDAPRFDDSRSTIGDTIASDAFHF